MEKTIAQQIAACLYHDGARYAVEGEDGREVTLREMAESAGGKETIEDGKARWVFRDGSAITDMGWGWGLGFKDCYCFQDVGHHAEECEAISQADDSAS